MSVSPWTEVRDRDDDLARERQERDVWLLDGYLVGYPQLPSL